MTEQTLSGILLDDNTELSVDDLCAACSESTAWVVELVDEGVLDPLSEDREHWRFSAVSLTRAYTAVRLQRDLGINPAGIALALELLDELNDLRARYNRINIPKAQ